MLIPQGGTDSTVYFMEEGENLCFDISFFDPDTPADSLAQRKWANF